MIFDPNVDLIQVGIGSSYSNHYPHFSDIDTLYNNQGIDVLYLNLLLWGTYASQGNEILLGHPNVLFGPVLTKPNSPIDIAPGSTFPYYNLADELMNRFSGVQCTFLLSKTATFIPTISALDFDTDDLFYDIDSDSDKLLKTPFDDIFGITGDNLSHVEGNIFNLDLLTWLNNQVTNFSDIACAFGDLIVEGVTINSVEEELYNESLTLTVSDVTVEVDANVKFYASESIKMLENTKLKAGSNSIAGIKSCTPKVCLYEPTFRITAPQNNGSLASVEKVKILDDEKIPLDEIGVNIYPNPTTNQITVESSKSYHLNIFNMMGQQVGQQNGQAKAVQFDMTKFEAGIYIFQFQFEDGTMESIRVVKQ
ncbi:MAG: T9SS type A sorting domain-containing protein [Saprospiraceae bacterium]|nr:T9SS type A sorting domain-containing protein [Saprospiraceae bacterium]